jgi:endonuclease G
MKKTKPFMFLGALAIILAAYIFMNKEESVQTEHTDFFSVSDIRDVYPFIPDVDEQIRRLTGFDLSYNETHEQANWVMYILTREELEGSVERSDDFRQDKKIPTGSASLADYRKSGYDRGHLAPAADMKWSEEAMSESFLMSNMSPQKPYFNRGIWKKLEEHVREIGRENDSVLVITGPVFKDILDSIGENEVSVPGYYFKLLLDLSWPDNKAVAYLMKMRRAPWILIPL